jgi:hypothetical protein
MKTSKTIVLALAMFCASTLSYSQSAENTHPEGHIIDAVDAREHIKAQFLLKRLDQIKAIDKSTLNPDQKKQLRKEVRDINKNMKEIGGGVYLSVGAIIIIVLLLILLL